MTSSRLGYRTGSIRAECWRLPPNARRNPALPAGTAQTPWPALQSQLISGLPTSEAAGHDLCRRPPAIATSAVRYGPQESLADADYGQLLAGRGIATVALTEDGQMVEHRPDGTSVLVTARP